jgi:hypothetical protein
VLGTFTNEGKVDSGHLILKPLELTRDLLRENIKAGGHELADLDHEAAEVNSERMEVASNMSGTSQSTSGRNLLEAKTWQY